jgi:transketolase
MKSKDKDLSKLVINTIRTLSIDAVQNANSGHPGAPMALAPVAFTLFDKFMNFNPVNPDWPNRDRFILSAGHASMLLYASLFLHGYDVTLDDIKSFRQLGSKCPGHPEYGQTPGVETTTGPLGQGAATSVGFAIAGKWLAAFFNRPGFEIMNYRIFVIVSDGDIMEGVCAEAASLAGHLGLDNLVWLYDNNHVSLAGPTSLTLSENVAERFRSYHWNVKHVTDANDIDDLEQVLDNAIKEKKGPSFIIVDSHIGYGAPTKQDSFEAHGSPLGEEEVRGAKLFYGWNPDKKFYIPSDIKRYTAKAIEKGAEEEAHWNEVFRKYAWEYPDLANIFTRIRKGVLTDSWASSVPVFGPEIKTMSGRKASSKALNAIASKVPWMIGGSADLDPSTLTVIDGGGDFEKGHYNTRNIHYGVREHAMVAITSGIALSKLKAYCSSFFIFTDYARPSIRLAALMKLPVVLIFTHDSIGLGEDGPTHQSIEQLASLRAMPNIDVMRPADANEVSVLWKYIMTISDHPVVLVLTRQDLPVFDRTKSASADGALRGAYILNNCQGVPDIILIGTGSEVQLCMGAFEVLMKEGVRTRVVSMPCWEVFERQDHAYRESVLPKEVKTRVAVEAGSVFGWERYVGYSGEGKMIGMTTFGTSAPGKIAMEAFGFTVENVVKTVKELISKPE